MCEPGKCGYLAKKGELDSLFKKFVMAEMKNLGHEKLEINEKQKKMTKD